MCDMRNGSIHITCVRVEWIGRRNILHSESRRPSRKERTDQSDILHAGCAQASSLVGNGVLVHNLFTVWLIDLLP